MKKRKVNERKKKAGKSSSVPSTFQNVVALVLWITLSVLNSWRPWHLGRQRKTDITLNFYNLRAYLHNLLSPVSEVRPSIIDDIRGALNKFQDCSSQQAHSNSWKPKLLWSCTATTFTFNFTFDQQFAAIDQVCCRNVIFKMAVPHRAIGPLDS